MVECQLLTDFHITVFKAWFHGSPRELTCLRTGSTITQIRHLAEVFSHKPTIVSVDDDGSIRHNGKEAGYLYLVTEPLQPSNIVAHPCSAMQPGWEWLTTRELPVELLGSVQIKPDK
jgi:hypothetical protein